MVIGKISCPCQTINCINRDILLQEFGAIRKQCAALREILVPESIWPDFQRKAQEDPNIVGHNYKVLGALQHGILSKITFPIHCYLLDGNKPKALKADYKKDLAEHWMEQKTPFERHKKAREHEGKLNELLCASWLENQGWKIDNLAALCGDFDIEATSADNFSCAIEVKYIGQEDKKFEEFAESRISGNAVGSTWSIYNGYNYFLFRTYEAAKQLSGCTKTRLAFITLSYKAWGFIEMAIKDNWITNRPIRFSENASSAWNAFLSDKKNENRFSDIEKDLQATIDQLNELWIIKQHSDLTYSRQSIFEFSNRS